MNDQITITAAKRIVVKGHKIWSEGILQNTGVNYLQLIDSISQEEFRRLIDMGLIDSDGFITKLYPLPRIIIRPAGGFF